MIVQLNQVNSEMSFVIQQSIVEYTKALELATEQSVVSVENIMHLDLINEISQDYKLYYFKQTLKLPISKAIVLARALQYYQTQICDIDYNNVLALKIKNSLLHQTKIYFI